MQSQMAVVVEDEATKLARLAALWQQIGQCLEAQKGRIVDEIGHYPSPIPACDAQFNGLLEDRAAILQEIGEVQEVLKRRLPAGEQVALLTGWMLPSRYLDAAVKENIRQVINES